MGMTPPRERFALHARAASRANARTRMENDYLRPGEDAARLGIRRRWQGMLVAAGGLEPPTCGLSERARLGRLLRPPRCPRVRTSAEAARCRTVVARSDTLSVSALAQAAPRIKTRFRPVPL